MKKCKCKLGKLVIGLLIGVVVLNIGLFAIFFFDLDGKLLFHVVEPFLKKHYDDMERDDRLKSPYDIKKYPKYDD